MKILLIVLIVAVLSLGGGMGYLILEVKNMQSAPMTTAEGEIIEQPEEVETREPIYTSLNPAFVITYDSAEGMKYLKTELQIMSYEQEVIDEVESNRPKLRNTLIMLLNSQDYAMLQTNDGRESLRAIMRDALQESLRSKLRIEEVFYNSFLIQ